ncbi:NF-kappa-B inhibitor-interacting Ras-like protein 2 isoform X3 [Tachypleus tridentatus]|uniref:NF-kappa-B inhibitor-interacting Ras-like protein 2 isoform X3 n=1 Tax=Tachypleus tridentatus TaxID=6853 RepID=UPI003FD13A00
MLRSVPPGKTSKVIVCGYEGCGKTSIIEQLIYGNLHLEKPIHPTIEDVYCAIIDNDRGGKEKICFYDTAGMKPSHCEVPRAYLTAADVPIIVLGNKVDKQKDRQVEVDKAKNWALREKVKLYEVSAAERRSLLDPFIFLTSKMNPPPGKSGFPQLGRKGRSSSVTMEL